MNHISFLTEHFGGIEKIDPHGEGNDNSIGAFVMFIIKDACEYAGLLPKRKENPARIFRNSMFKFNELTSKTEVLS